MYELIKATRALSDETRIRILNLLQQRECCVCEVMQVLAISQTRASRNLGMLYEAGFLNLRKEGLWSHYSIDKTGLDSWRLGLLDAIADSLKNNPVARTDLAALERAIKTGQSCQVQKT